MNLLIQRHGTSQMLCPIGCYLNKANITTMPPTHGQLFGNGPIKKQERPCKIGSAGFINVTSQAMAKQSARILSTLAILRIVRVMKLNAPTIEVEVTIFTLMSKINL